MKIENDYYKRRLSLDKLKILFCDRYLKIYEEEGFDENYLKMYLLEIQNYFKEVKRK